MDQMERLSGLLYQWPLISVWTIAVVVMLPDTVEDPLRWILRLADAPRASASLELLKPAIRADFYRCSPRLHQFSTHIFFYMWSRKGRGGGGRAAGIAVYGICIMNNRSDMYANRPSFHLAVAAIFPVAILQIVHAAFC